MQVYLVGGAVRDELLSRPVHERDWVVVGAHPQELVDQGYRSVGKEFPVFLHPETHEEYALARTERKIGPGYKGFQCYAAADVTLEQDLLRRDFTMNAIAQDKNGHLVDPFGGAQDIKNGIIKHVSAAFSEDPVRLVRAARFAAQLPAFSIHEDTMRLMQSIVTSGEAKHVIAERLWQECAKALLAPAPWRFFSVLQSCGFLQDWDGGVAIDLTGFESRCAVMPHAPERWALCWAAATEEQAKQLNQRWRVPKRYAVMLRLMLRWRKALLDAMSAEQVLAVLEGTDAVRFPKRFMQLVELIGADKHGTAVASDSIKFWQGVLAVMQVPVSDGMPTGLLGPEVKKWVHERRLTRLKKHLSEKKS